MSESADGSALGSAMLGERRDYSMSAALAFGCSWNTCKVTNLLCGVFLQMLTFSQLVKEFLAFY